MSTAPGTQATRARLDDATGEAVAQQVAEELRPILREMDRKLDAMIEMLDAQVAILARVQAALAAPA